MRLHAAGGRVAYVAAAGLEHRRQGDDARLRSLARSEYGRGRAARRSDRRKGSSPTLAQGAARPGRSGLAHGPPPLPSGNRDGCALHGAPGRGAARPVSGARSPSPERLPDPQTFLSGESGTVAGKRLVATARLADAGIGLARALALTGPRLDRAAAALAPQRVLALSVYRPGSRLPEAIGQLRSARHDVHFALGSTGAPDPSSGR